MSKVLIHTEIDTKSLLLDLAHLQISELEEFANELNAFIKKKKSHQKSSKAEQLLLEIHQCVLPKEERLRYIELVNKLEQEIISEEERQLCLSLASKDEKLRNKRVSLMIQLAALRNISFNQLMIELGLQPINNG
ncbi:MAG: hypothetical protein AAF847_08370 [Bacteroidota bacterium]